MRAHLDLQVRDTLNNVAESWSDTEKEHCLEETKESFKVRALVAGPICGSFEESRSCARRMSAPVHSSWPKQVCH